MKIGILVDQWVNLGYSGSKINKFNQKKGGVVNFTNTEAVAKKLRETRERQQLELEVFKQALKSKLNQEQYERAENLFSTIGKKHKWDVLLLLLDAKNLEKNVNYVLSQLEKALISAHERAPKKDLIRARNEILGSEIYQIKKLVYA